MNRHVAIVALMLAFSAHADDVSKMKWQEKCKGVSEVAKSIMEARQGGAPMSKLMDIAAENGIMQAMVRDAYSVPHYSVEANKNRAAADFSNEQYAMCANVFNHR